LSERRWRTPSLVIPGRRGAPSFDVQLHIRESITTLVSMDSGPAPSGASRNDGGEIFVPHECLVAAQTKTPASLPGFCISCNRLSGQT
jgi:hypothetical protein